MAAAQSKAWIAVALESLAATKATAVDREIREVPPRPGLYAIHSVSATWEELQLGAPPDERPLYVGKSESSLAGRDVTTHFGFTGAKRTTSVTGYSTVRRSIAALLHDSHGFRGMPRNPEKPGHFANYGLSRKHDEFAKRDHGSLHPCGAGALSGRGRAGRETDLLGRALRLGQRAARVEVSSSAFRCRRRRACNRMT